jgi:hypothetical protein
LPAVDYPHPDAPFPYSSIETVKKTKTIIKTRRTKKQSGAIVAQSAHARNHCLQGLARAGALWLVRTRHLIDTGKDHNAANESESAFACVMSSLGRLPCCYRIEGFCRAFAADYTERNVGCCAAGTDACRGTALAELAIFPPAS